MNGVYLMSLHGRNLPGWQVENEEHVAKFLATWVKDTQDMTLVPKPKSKDFYVLVADLKVGQLAYLRKK